MRALDVTSRAETATDNVFPLGLQREKRIESYDAVNFSDGYSRTPRNDFLNFERNISVFLLNVAQYHHKRSFFVGVSVADFVDLFDRRFL